MEFGIMRPLTQNALHLSLKPRRGLTLVELVIGIAITGIVASVLAILINSTAAGTNSQQDGRRALVKLESMKAQLEDQFTNARAILATGTNYIVYWTGDLSGAVTPANGAVNLSELRLLEVDTTTGNLNLYAVSWPSTFSSANIISNDQVYAANSSWYTACQTAKTTGYFLPTVVATNVTQMTSSLDSTTYAQAHMISAIITFSDTVTSRDMLLGATMLYPTNPW
jgi:prepilin-type N-terminal cleavage/methylation domain-containing protein